MKAAEWGALIADPFGQIRRGDVEEILRDFEAAEQSCTLQEDTIRTLQRVVRDAEARAQAAEANSAELERLFALQQTRMAEATEAWRAATGMESVLPDLGELLSWLLSRAQAEQQRREAAEALVRELEIAYAALRDGPQEKGASR